MQVFRRFLVIAIGSTLALTSCIGSRESPAERERNANTAAGKVGRAAHAVAKQTEKAARAAGKKLGQAAHEAHDGWQEAARADREKRK